MSTVMHLSSLSRPFLHWLFTVDDIRHFRCRDAHEGRETEAARAYARKKMKGQRYKVPEGIKRHISW